MEVLDAWGEGLSGLLAFTTQIALTLVLAHALAHTDPVRRLLMRIAAIPGSAAGAYATVVVTTGLASLVAWSLGLAVGALLAGAVARAGRARGLELDYPLLVASAYSGFVVWHMGYSGSAPLFVATPGHALEGVMGVLPVSQTILAPWNLGLALLVLGVLAVLCARMAPPDATSFEPPLEQEDAPVGEVGPRGIGEVLDGARPLVLLLGLLVLLWMARWFQRGGGLTLDMVNWSFLAAGLLLSRSPVHYVRLVTHAGGTLGPILLQYPFYAGIMGLMVGTGLVGVCSAFFVDLASADTLAFWAFLAGGIVNFFVPSGGGQWVVQGPVFIDAAQQLGTPPALVVMGVAYGDQWSNLIQPFWTIPLLAIAGLPLRSVLGYCFLTFLAAGLLFGSALLLIPHLL